MSSCSRSTAVDRGAHLHGEQLQAFDAVLGLATTDLRSAGACVAVISLSEGQP